MTIDPRKLPYWKTSSAAPDTWLDKAEAEIEKAGGTVTARASASMGQRHAFRLTFELEGDTYLVDWPVLDSDDPRAARRQAATALYHDVKARCVARRFIGDRRAFLPFLLGSGGTVGGYFDADQDVDQVVAAAGLLPPGGASC